MEALKTALNELRRRTTGTPQLWAPSDLYTHRHREKTLMQRMEICIKILGNSRFYHDFRHLLQTSSVSEHLRKVLGSYSKMHMVIYGIGNFESCKSPMLQLSLAILMQKDFKWIGNIKVFDPILSAAECRILEALGCSVLCFDEYGMRKVLEPTLFFMPHCPLDLYINVLQANWNLDLLSKVVIFGNSFDKYKKDLGPNYLRSIWAAHRFTNEFTMRIKNRRLSFLQPLSWIFFNPTEMELQFMNNVPHYIIEREMDLQIDLHREKTLVQTIESCINNLKSSQFYYNFQVKLQTPPIYEHLHMVMGSESKMQMVIYGIGSIELNKNSMLQLSLAILMRKDFKQIGGIEVFDPVLSATECRVLKAFGCSILSLNQYKRRRQALKPTVFFIPHFSTMLYNDFLKVNWESDLLSNIVLFANSLMGYVYEDPYRDLDSLWYILFAQTFTKEFRINTISDDLHKTSQESRYCKDYYNAFHRLSWHFFGLIEKAQLQVMNKLMNEYVKAP